jgi:hypothetical protein
MRRVLDVAHSDSDSGIRTTDDGQRMTGEGGRVRIEFLSGGENPNRIGFSMRLTPTPTPSPTPAPNCLCF